MSVSKPFVFALVCETIGPEEARERLGANATGLPSIRSPPSSRADGRTNPMVNAGAIATTSLVPGETRKENGNLSTTDCRGFAGRKLPLNEEVYARRGDQLPQPQHRPAAAEL